MPEAEVDVGGEGEAAVGKQRGEPVAEVLGRAHVVHDPVGAPDDHVGAVGVLRVAVLQDDPAALPRLEDELGDAQVVGRPPRGEQGSSVRWRQTTSGAAASERRNAERAAVGPARLLSGEPLGVEVAPVAVVGLARAAGLSAVSASRPSAAASSRSGADRSA